MPLPDKLPDSSKEITTLLIVALAAGIASLSRMLYGKDDLHWRNLVAGFCVASITGVLVYSAMVTSLGPKGGYFALMVGLACGMFTDDVLKRTRQYFRARVFNSARDGTYREDGGESDEEFHQDDKNDATEK